MRFAPEKYFFIIIITYMMSFFSHYKRLFALHELHSVSEPYDGVTAVSHFTKRLLWARSLSSGLEHTALKLFSVCRVQRKIFDTGTPFLIIRKAKCAFFFFYPIAIEKAKNNFSRYDRISAGKGRNSHQIYSHFFKLPLKSHLFKLSY